MRTPRGETKDFPIGIGLHQRSALSPYLFNLVLNVLIRDIQKIVPNCMPFADDIFLIEESKGSNQHWRQTLKTKDFPLSRRVR